jgi:hypothetical protein
LSLVVDKRAVIRWTVYFTLIDLLFLPYFQLVIIPFSLPLLLAAAVLLRMHIKKDRYYGFFLAFAVPTLVSAAISFLLPESRSYLSEDVKRVIQLLSSFTYFFFFRWAAEQTRLRITPIVVVFVAWFALLAVLFVLSPLSTQEFMRTVYGRLVTADDTIESHLRFAYVFTDANTAGYFLLVASSVLLLSFRSMVPLLLTAAVLCVLVFMTQSKGATGALLLMVATAIYAPSRLVSLLSARRALAVVTLVCVGVAVGLRLASATELNAALHLAFERLFASTDRLATGASRLAVWRHFMQSFSPLPFGRGFILTIDGVSERPHSDLLRVAYSYGLLAVPPLLAFLFSRAWSLAPLIVPALMAFLINSLLDEQKIFALFLCLLGLSVGAAERARRDALARVPAWPAVV